MDRLDREIEVAQAQHASRGGRLERSGLNVRLWLPGMQIGTAIELDGSAYDAEPFSVRVVGQDGQPLSADRWPPGLFHSQHPVLHRPFACLQGVLEYHLHPSHLGDSWDRYRQTIRLVDLVGHIIIKVAR